MKERLLKIKGLIKKGKIAAIITAIISILGYVYLDQAEKEVDKAIMVLGQGKLK